MFQSARAKSSNILSRTQKLVPTVFITTILCVSCVEPPIPSSDAVREALKGRRAIQPALSGLPDSGKCSAIPGFIPRVDCREGFDAIESPGVQALYDAFRARLADKPTSDELHGGALLRLALGPRDADDVRVAIADLHKALASVDDAAKRAELLADLASAYLLLAEVQQSSVEVAAALEAVLEALELDPANSEARFNQRLALLLLGIDRGDNFAENFTLDAIAPHVHSKELDERDVSRETKVPIPSSSCLFAREIRMALDTWVTERTSVTWVPLAEELVCSVDADDRFFPDLLAAAANEPDRLAASWINYQGLEAGARAFDPDELQKHLDGLADTESSEAVRIAGDYFLAWLPFQEGDYSEAEKLLERHQAETRAMGYLGLTVKAVNFQILIEQIRGEYGAALTKLEEAEGLSRRLGIEALTSKLQSQRSQLEILGGREYDAWRSQVLAIRGLDPDSQGEALVGSLGVLADVAIYRGFDRMALHLRNRAVLISETLGPGTQISSLRARGEALARLGQVGAARQDLAQAVYLFNSSPESLLARDTLRAGLSYLEGLAVETNSKRRAALESTLKHYKAIEYDRRILDVQHALATAQNDDGDTDAALATLEDAFDELAEQVAGAATWSSATALVAAARPIVDMLVGLQLDHSQPEVVFTTIGRYLGLRSKQDVTIDSIRVEGPRLTTFVRRDEVLLLLESSDELMIIRQPVERKRLSFLRDQVLLRAMARADGLEATLADLASFLIVPVYKHLEPDESETGAALTIVADDILAGTPFHLFPTGKGAELMIDRWAISYQADLRIPAPEKVPTRVLAVGASGRGSRLQALPFAEDEAQGIAAFYPQSPLLIGANATLDGVRALLAADAAATTHFEAVHISSHFEVNFRWPLQSSLLLNSDPASSHHVSRRLTLHELLDWAPEGLSLLYLSACDTGIGIPLEAHGLNSLAQAYTSTGVHRTVLTLWLLDDEIGTAIAIRFHELYSSGLTAAEALRAAQLEHRDEHLATWGALIIAQ